MIKRGDSIYNLKTKDQTLPTSQLDDVLGVYNGDMKIIDSHDVYHPEITLNYAIEKFFYR